MVYPTSYTESVKLSRRAFVGGLAAMPLLAADEGWIPLFNGKNLDGWKPSEHRGAWKVHDGQIVTEAEWAIIKAVWEMEPCTAPDIREKLRRQTAWAYSTVRTLMDRMVVKGLLAAEKVRNLTVYRSGLIAAVPARTHRGRLLV